MKLLIFDGNSILNRAFYGIRLLSNSEGLYTNAVYGFVNIYLKFLEEEHPDYVCVAFDLKGPTFRNEAFEAYKANRKGMPEELAVQLPVIKDVLTKMGVTLLSAPSFEGDDVIGTVASMCSKQGIECTVVTGDKDSLQLINELVTVKLITTRGKSNDTEIMTPAAFLKKYGFEPENMVDLKALMGDSSDNIPGVAGIGEKTAMALIQKYGNIDYIYENLDNLDEKDNVKRKLRDGKEMAYKSYSLAAIVTDVPLEIKIEDCTLKGYSDDLVNLFDKLGFKKLTERLGLSSAKDVECVECSIKEVMGNELEDKIEKSSKLYYLLRGEGLFANVDGEVWLFKRENEDFADILKWLMENEAIEKFTYNSKEDFIALFAMGIELAGTPFCAKVAGYIANASDGGDEEHKLCEKYLGKILPEKAGSIEYNGAFCLLLPKLVEALIKIIEERNQHRLLYEVELPLCRVLAFMQIYGFKVEKEKLIEYGKGLDLRIERCQQDIYLLAGREFNINSPKQLGEVLFDELLLPPVKKTKTGYATGAEVLEKLEPYHKIIPLIIEYRQLTKLKSTYVTGLISVIDEKTGRIHSSFNQTVTQTGRISSTEPNLQNIPIRLELGREIRKVFVCENEEYTLLDADYSQIELRVLAHIADDSVMQEAFAKGEDIHSTTASQVFKAEKESVTPLMRSRAKAVNFGIVYGIGDFSLSQDLKIPRKEARKYIDAYLETYKGVRNYMENTVKSAKELGYTETLLNRRRYLPELASKNAIIRKFGERCAMNTPIQGTAADIIKLAMIHVFDRLKEEKLSSRLILQVHDELIIETKKSELELVRRILREEMENVLPLKVKLAVDMSDGDSWFDAKE